jgi:4-diphosphocytidyl-2-C-methyl-D-erythritol kinase
MRHQVRVLAPAKVNLYLAVTGRRPDGYHAIESLMVPVSWYDELHLTVAATRTGRSHIECRTHGSERVAGGRGNLVARAAHAVLRELSVGARVLIRLHKRIPVGAGLGGGSSDAAAVLRTLPRLLGRRLSAERAHDLALELGADVPFFLACRAAWASGIGDRFAMIRGFPRLELAIVVPAKRVSTAWAYAHALPARARMSARKRGTGRRRVLHPTVDSLNSLVFNDFEAGVARAVPDVARLRRALSAKGARAVVMSGSGSAVVGVFASRAEAELAASEFGSPDTAMVARTIGRRPATGWH